MNAAALLSRNRWAGRLLPWAAGLAQAGAIAWPGNGQPLWWLQLASLAVLVWQIDRIRADAAPGRR